MITNSFRTRAGLAFPLALVATLTATTKAQAGPTLGADLDLGTSTISFRSDIQGMAPPATLYDVGFRIRAGWRFDLGPAFLVPEVGGGYDVERTVLSTNVGGGSYPWARVLGGARAGWSFALLPVLRFEPAIYGHMGYARTTLGGTSGLANDVGLALDLRFLRFFTIGPHIGYDVVTQFLPAPPCLPSPLGVSTGCAQARTIGDGWLAYGIQAGVVLW